MLVSGREVPGTFVTLLAVGAPQFAVMAHVWWAGVSSFPLICIVLRIELFTPTGTAHTPADPPDASKVHALLSLCRSKGPS